MTKVYFVRHAQQEYARKEDRTGPLTEDFLRIIDWMPYFIELDFEGNELVGKYEYCHVEKEFKGNKRADKKWRGTDEYKISYGHY